jgi:energy-coupling factor transport system permease protein
VTLLIRLNFFLKLVAASAVTALAWIVDAPLPALLLMAAVLALLVALRLPGLRGYLRGAAILFALVFATWMLNFWLEGVPPFDAAATALRLAARLVATTGAFFFVMETSSPGSILAAASALRLPAMATLVLALLFGLIPMLRDEFERIGEAQRARGMELDEVPLWTRLRYGLARGVPLLVQSLRMAHAISTSLSVYGFDAKVRRTSWRHVGMVVEDRLPRPAAVREGGERG